MSLIRPCFLGYAYGAAALLAMPAHAQDKAPDGWFASVSGMYVLQLDSDLNAPFDEVTFDSSYGLTVAAGHKLVDMPLRLELEYGYRAGDIDKIKTGGTSSSVSGDYYIQSLMFNALWDYKFDDSPLGLYAGGGLGVAFSKGKVNRIAGAYVGESDRGTNFAYQLMGGLNFYLADNAVLFGGVRWFEVVGTEFEGIDVDNQSVNFELGLRFYF